MLSKEDFEKLLNTLKEKLDETTRALVAEEMLAILSSYNNSVDEYDKVIIDRDRLAREKDELIKVNGRLYQQIGFDDKKEIEEKKEDKEEIKIEDVINEKGEIV